MKSVVSGLLIAGFASLASVANAETQTIKAECYERSNLLTALAAEHGERLAQTRRVGSNGLLEAFKSPTDGSWTIVYSNDDKMSCVLATGDGLETGEDDYAPTSAEFTI